MLVAAEGFDNLHPHYYYSIPGFVCCHGLQNAISELVSPQVSPRGIASLPFYSDLGSHDIYNYPILQSYGVSSGRYAVLGTEKSYLRPFLFPKSRKVTVGFSFGFQLQNYVFSTNRSYPGSLFSSAVNLYSGWGSLLFFDVCFLNNPKPLASTLFSSGDGVAFICRFYITKDHSVNIRFMPAEIYNSTHSAFTDLYPPISSSGEIPIDLFDSFNYIEVSVDSSGAINSNGSAEVRINGKTVYRRENIVSSAYLLWGSDTFSELSYFRSVGFGCVDKNYEIGYGGQPNILIDNVYVTNETGGVSDSFLGPLKISAQDSVSFSVDEFDETPSEDAEPDDFVRTFLELNPTRFLSSSSVGSSDLFSVSAPFINRFSSILGISHRIGSIGNDTNPPNTPDSVVAPVFVSPGHDPVVSNIECPSVPGLFSIRDAIYSYNPNTFSQFTADDVTNSLFGFRHVPADLVDILSGRLPVFVSGDYFVNPANCTDGQPLTYCSARYSYFSIYAGFDDLVSVEAVFSVPASPYDVSGTLFLSFSDASGNPVQSYDDVPFRDTRSADGLTFTRVWQINFPAPIHNLLFYCGSGYSNTNYGRSNIYRISAYRAQRTS
jgi:hypothetical protein